MLKHRRKKIVLVTVLVLAGLLAGSAAALIYTVQRTKSDLAQAIRQRRGTAAVVAYSIDEQGEPLADGQDIFYNADTPLILASTVKLVVLAAYEQAVAQGELDPQEQVSAAELERYYLPLTDGSAHAQGLASLGLESDALGFSRDPQAPICLDDIARIMIHYSGNAETDYLIARLGSEPIAAVLQAAGFEQHSTVRPILGALLAIFNHEKPLWKAGQRLSLLAEFERGDTRALEQLEERYRNDAAWRAAQIAFLQSEAFAAGAAKMTWEDQVQIGQWMPRGTAREYARLMAKIASGNFLSPQISARMQRTLENQPFDWPLRLLYFRRYGGKDGLTAGLLALASYAEPKNGPLAGRSRVVVILTNELSQDVFAAQMSFEGAYLLQTDLARAVGVFREPWSEP
jgi:D-alanyl-D-alanine carboxypeptidase